MRTFKEQIAADNAAIFIIALAENKRETII